MFKLLYLVSATQALVELPLYSQKVVKQPPLTSLVSSQEDVITSQLSDFMDVQLFVKLYIGANHQPFQLILDTGSNWLWVYSRLCGNCPQDKFDET